MPTSPIQPVQPEPHFLVLEDHAADFELLRARLLEDGVQASLQRVESRAAYTEALQRKPAVILADNCVPGFSGVEALELRNQMCPEIPFVLTSRTISEDFAIECLRKGATDYVLKSNLSKFAPVLRRALEQSEAAEQRRRAQWLIEQNEKRNRTLLESIADIVWIAGGDGAPLPPQNSWEAFTGLPVDRWADCIHPDDVDRIRAAWESAVAECNLFAVEYRLRRHDGEYRWMQVRGVPVHDTSGRVMEWTGVMFDITDAKLAESRLRASEELYRATFDRSSVGIAHVGPDGAWLRFNDRVCEITGYSADELSRLTFQDVTYPEDLGRDLEQYAQLLRGEIDRYSMEKRYRHKSGKLVWVNLTVTMLRDASGAPVHSISVIQDITPRKEAQALLAEQSERLQAALLASRTGTFRWDIRTNALDWDENLDRLFGLAPGATARSLDQFVAMVHPEDRAGVISRCERCASEGADFEMEFRVQWPSGAERWLYDRGKTFFDESGRPAYMTGACTDITESKAAHETLRRTEKLAAVASLASSISHEINNPLEAVMNCVFLLRTSPDLPEPLESYAELALQELNRASHIVSQALRFHRQSTHAAEVLVSESLEYLLDVFAPKLRAANIRVVTDFSREVPVVGYESELRQVLANLISNAIDAMRGEGGTLAVRARPQLLDGRHGLRIVFADTGHGMPEHVKARAFEPFYTTKDINGTGLGLWITQELVEKHGGSIRFRSRVEQGTVFSIFLPLSHHGFATAAIA